MNLVFAYFTEEEVEAERHQCQQNQCKLTDAEHLPYASLLRVTYRQAFLHWILPPTLWGGSVIIPTLQRRKLTREEIKKQEVYKLTPKRGQLVQSNKTGKLLGAGLWTPNHVTCDIHSIYCFSSVGLVPKLSSSHIAVNGTMSEKDEKSGIFWPIFPGRLIWIYFFLKDDFLGENPVGSE